MSNRTQSPSSRMARSISLSEQNLNLKLNLDNVTMPVTSKDIRAKTRVASMGGESFVPPGGQRELSPATRARNMRPRKSILKSLPTRPETADENATESHQYAHTIAFSINQPAEGVSVDDKMRRQSTGVGRRVSFAPNMHVRYLQVKGAEEPQPIALPPNTFARTATGPRPSNGAHSRRSSIQNIASVSHPVFVTEGEEDGEASMDIETASEASSDEDSEVEMGGPPRFEGAGARFSLGGMQGGEEDAEGEEDMDMTQVVYGGIARRASMAASNADEEVGESMVDDDEKTMDFTLAIGGVLPNTAPAGASTLRNSIGYSFPSSPNSAGARLHPGDAMEGEMDMSMDETVALGGIIGADDSLSSGGSGEDTMANRERTMTFSFNPGNNDDDGMDMTVAGGGIIGFPVMSSALPSQAAPTSPTSTSAKLATGTPSFARPTMSSAQKTKATEKRNVFAPSPSPYKSTTPRGGVMDAAGDVAKRLSFGSTTSSGGKKRARENDDETSPAKRRSMVAEEVFGVPTPPMGTPKRTVSPRKSPRNSSSLTSKSPARSPMLRRVLGLPTNDQEEREGQTEWDTPPTITLAAFLEMAGVQFMEGLPGLTRRRSSVAKGLLGASGYGGNDREFALHEYTAAQIQSVFLNMYTWAANKMKDDIREGQAQLAATELDCSVHNPPVVREYLSASDEDRQLFEMTFKAFKTNTQLKARERWYDWKMGLIERVGPDVEEMLRGMQEDAERLGEMEGKISSLLPDLQDRHAALLAELEKERALVAELELCDPAELAEYRDAITEQTTQIAGFTSELQESTAQLRKLEASLADLKAKKAEATSAIQVARSKCDQFTKSDVFRLQEEYTSLQSLHLWRPTRMVPDALVLEYDAEIRLSFACSEHRPDFSSATVELLPLEAGMKVGRAKGPVERNGPTEPLFGVFGMAVRMFAGSKGQKTLPSFVQQVGQLWTAAQRLRQEFRYTVLVHPMSYHLDASKRGTMIASAKVMLPSVRARAEVNFEITEETLAGWPGSAAGVEVKAKAVYGDADAELLTRAAKATVELACEEGYLGVFLQSCLDAASQYT